VPTFATLRLTWEPRMLSILRIVVGLLYMEHGLAKVLGFPRTYAR
jgi:putative oxidoreductase